MERVVATNSAASGDTPPVGGTPQFFTNGNPGSAIPATVVPAYWLNGIGEELLAIITAAGITPDRTNNAQVLAAILALIHGKASYLTGLGGTVNAITATRAGGGAPVLGEVLYLPCAGANTGPVTINVNGTGAVPAVKNISGGAAALTPADILAGNTYPFLFDGTNLQLLRQRPYSKGASVASAATVDLDNVTGDYIHITGTAGITAIHLRQGEERTLVFDGVLTITGSSSLILPGAAASITTVAGATAKVRGEDAANTVVFVSFTNGSQGLATSADVIAGSSTSKAITPAALLAAIGFSSTFISTGQTITAGGPLTIAHGLPRTPDPSRIRAYLQCTTNDIGYTAGQKKPVSISQKSTSASDSYGAEVVPDGTNLNIRFGSAAGVLPTLNFGTGTDAAINLSNWQIYFEADA